MEHATCLRRIGVSHGTFVTIQCSHKRLCVAPGQTEATLRRQRQELSWSPQVLPCLPLPHSLGSVLTFRIYQTGIWVKCPKLHRCRGHSWGSYLATLTLIVHMKVICGSQENAVCFTWLFVKLYVLRGGVLAFARLCLQPSGQGMWVAGQPLP